MLWMRHYYPDRTNGTFFFALAVLAALVWSPPFDPRVHPPASLLPHFPGALAALPPPAPKLSFPPPCPLGGATSTVLITGIAGMIGSHVARELAARPCTRVVGLVRPRSNLDTLAGILHRLTLVVGDLSDAHRMDDILREVRPQFVYHLAAQAINGISYANAELTMDVNVCGTLNLLEAVRRAGLGGFSHPAPTRVLLAGSSTEYGRAADHWEGAVPERAPLQPVTPYGVSKVAMELLGNMYNYSHGVPVVTARFFLQIGVGGTDSLAVHQFARQIALAEAGLAPPVVEHGNLDSTRDMSDARDTAPVIVALAERGVPGEAYNVGSGNAVPTSDLLAEALAQARVAISTKADPSRLRVYDERVLLADVSKVRKLTGWTPATNMSAAVAQILGYWRSRITQLYITDEGREP
jgi:GDP-4-dehydro-6-deoxy-D-mannose reductase